MSIAELKAEVAHLSDQERRELAVYLSELDRLFPPGMIEKLSAKIDDKAPDHWISLEELEKRLEGTD